MQKNNELKLYQINLSTAVYMCVDKTCPYPMGHEWMTVSRTLNEITQNQSQKSLKSDFDKCFAEALEIEMKNKERGVVSNNLVDITIEDLLKFTNESSLEDGDFFDRIIFNDIGVPTVK